MITLHALASRRSQQHAISPPRLAMACAAAMVAIALLLSPAALLSAHAGGPALLYDATTDKVLYAEEPDRLWHPASLTKLMTAYVVFQEIKAGRLAMDDRCVQSENAQKEQPSKIGLPVGATMTIDKALDALIIKSANDVAVMLAEKISGTVAAFGERMTREARRIGMTRTVFVNPNGLPDRRQVTTARDMAFLARALLKDFPEHGERFTKQSMRLGRLTLRSHNSLLRTFEGADGMKTGFICDSGFNIVASATRDDRRLIAVVLGGVSSGARNLRTKDLLSYGFEVAAWRAVVPTPDIDTMPLAPEFSSRAAVIRNKVRSFACGYRGRRRAALRPTTARRATTRSARVKSRPKLVAKRPSAFATGGTR